MEGLFRAHKFGIYFGKMTKMKRFAASLLIATLSLAVICPNNAMAATENVTTSANSIKKIHKKSDNVSKNEAKSDTSNRIQETEIVEEVSENEIIEEIDEEIVDEIIEEIVEDELVEDAESTRFDFSNFVIPESSVSDEDLLVGIDQLEEYEDELAHLISENDASETVEDEDLTEDATIVSGFTLPDIPMYNEEDVDLLARLIWHESEGEPRVGKIAVGEVVLNRINSRYYPDTVHDVIYQKGQFSYVQYVKYEHPDAETRLIAEDVLNHGLKVLNNDDVLYFRNPTITSGLSASSEINWGRHKYYTYYGHHSFYLHTPFKGTAFTSRQKYFNVLSEDDCTNLIKQDREDAIRKKKNETEDSETDVIDEETSEEMSPDEDSENDVENGNAEIIDDTPGYLIDIDGTVVPLLETIENENDGAENEAETIEADVSYTSGNCESPNLTRINEILGILEKNA